MKSFRFGVNVGHLAHGPNGWRKRASGRSVMNRHINLEFYLLNYQLTNEINFSSLTSKPDGEGRRAREL